MTEPAAVPRARASYDPFAPPAPAFPRTRLTRAGLGDELVDNLEEKWGDLSDRQRRGMAAFVTRSRDSVIVARYTEPEGETTDVRAQLEAKKAGELKDMLRAQGKPVSGNHAALVDRLLEDNEQRDGETADDGDETTDDGDQVVGEPADGEDGEQAEVEVDGEVVTGTIPAAAATETPDAGTGDGTETTEE